MYETFTDLQFILYYVLKGVTSLTLIVSAILFAQVLRHYFFFNIKSKKPSKLKNILKHVFLGDLLMALSVVTFKMSKTVVGFEEDYYEDIELRLALNILQLLSVTYAAWANIKLGVFLLEEEEKK